MRTWSVCLDGREQFTYTEWTRSVGKRIFDLKRHGIVSVVSWGKKDV